MTPTVGRIVHYQSHGTPGGEYLAEARAAIVTAVHPCPAGSRGLCADDYCGGDTVSLAVLNPSGLFFDQAVPYADTPTPGHWTWPPRVETMR